MTKLEELEKRIEKLENLLADNESSNNLNTSVIRYMILSADETKVLSYAGFKSIEKSEHTTTRLFKYPSEAMKYLNRSNTYKNMKTKIKRVLITYDFMDGSDDDE